MTETDALVLRSSFKGAYRALTVAGVLCFAAGAFLLAKGDPFGWWSIGLFAFFCGVPLYTLAILRPWLRLDDAGFRYRFGRLSRAYLWHEVGMFTVGALPFALWQWPKYVFFTLSPGANVQRGRGNRYFRALTGSDSRLPDTFGLSADRLAGLLNERRSRSITSATPRSEGGVEAGTAPPAITDVSRRRGLWVP
jgi:hypothetical protein